MPLVEVLIYREDDGTAPLVDWLTSLPAEARDRCLARLALLHDKGHELRRPHAENLGEGLVRRVIRCRIPYAIRRFLGQRTWVNRLTTRFRKDEGTTACR
jgi:hypothetical protein